MFEKGWCFIVNENDPEEVLYAYFNALSSGDYQKVVYYYGGTYEMLQGYHPKKDPNDHPNLMRGWIEITGGQRVSISEIISVEEINSEIYTYEILFNELPQMGNYDYVVEKIDGKFKVMDLPPLIP